MSILSTPEYDQNEESSTFPYNRKILIMAIILLSIVVSFIILIQIYARWFKRRRLNFFIQGTQANLSDDGFYETGALSEGLDSKAIASLPKFVYGNKLDASSSSSSECVVCLSGIEEGETIRILNKCDHMFHVECIDIWLMSHSTCPICRGAVAVELLATEDFIQPQTVISVTDEEDDVVRAEDQEIGTIIQEEIDNSVSIVINDHPKTLSSPSSSFSSASSSIASSTCSCSLQIFVNRVLTWKQVD